jgi:predicted nucleotidyltransferase
MVADLTNEIDLNVRAFLQSVVEWAKNEPDLMALALVGSHARGEASPESDVDLILLLSNPKEYLNDRDWISEFGEPRHIVHEDWGKVTSLRVLYTEGLEVEYGLSNLAWGSDPSDEGDAQVIGNGLIVLYEKDGHLSNKLKPFLKSFAPNSIIDAG